MYKREFDSLNDLEQSIFLFGPRGTGKTSWVKQYFPNALYIDLLDTKQYMDLLNRPWDLEKLVDAYPDAWVVIDEVQKIPELLNEVHRLIESKNRKFVLTGSSARSLRKKGVNLLAGRALTYYMHPLTARELGEDYDLQHSLKYGQLPHVYTKPKPETYLNTYIDAYIRQEVLQEGLTRRLDAFSRMLEVASFSQGGVLNYTNIAKEVGVSRKVIESYFEILEDLLLGVKLPVFTRRAKRRMTAHPKFYFVDAGIFRTLRPRGAFDTDSEIDGAALETLFFQELRALNDYKELRYSLYYWRTAAKQEVDFVLYGEKGFYAFEIKRAEKVTSKDLKSLKLFGEDYPEANLYLIHNGKWREKHGNITVIPFTEAVQKLASLIG